ncbi:Tripartite DNA replication factor [Rhizophlyctis rosea]|nr:Tripartite DNA replication factor [Rhizophlyctis rosea]
MSSEGPDNLRLDPPENPLPSNRPALSSRIRPLNPMAKEFISSKVPQRPSSHVPDRKGVPTQGSQPDFRQSSASSTPPSAVNTYGWDNDSSSHGKWDSGVDFDKWGTKADSTTYAFKNGPPPPPIHKNADSEYIDKWKDLVAQELKEEERLVKERLELWSLPRLQSEGIVLTDLRCITAGVFFGKRVLKFFRYDQRMLPFHKFGYDMSVAYATTCFVRNPVLYLGAEISGANDITVTCEGQLPEDLTQGTWRVDKGSNTIAYDRMNFALIGMGYDVPDPPDALEVDFSIQAGGPKVMKKKKQKSSSGVGFWDAGDPIYEEEVNNGAKPRGTTLRAAILSPEKCREWAGQPSELLPENAIEWAQDVMNGKPVEHLQGLNESQALAVALAMSTRLSVLQGPPGTGKTTTIVRFIKLLKTDFKCDFPLLACAQSNVAVDNLLEGLVDAGVDAVRVGQPVKVREGLRDRTLDSLIQNHPDCGKVEELKKRVNNLKSQLPYCKGKEKGLINKELAATTKELRSVQDRMMKKILKKAQVICATCVGAGSDTLETVKFPMVVLDEGSQCSEPEALIPIVKGSEHVVLVGDHFQV